MKDYRISDVEKFVNKIVVDNVYDVSFKKRFLDTVYELHIVTTHMKNAEARKTQKVELQRAKKGVTK